MDSTGKTNSRVSVYVPVSADSTICFVPKGGFYGAHLSGVWFNGFLIYFVIKWVMIGL